MTTNKKDGGPRNTSWSRESITRTSANRRPQIGGVGGGDEKKEKGKKKRTTRVLKKVRVRRSVKKGVKVVQEQKETKTPTKPGGGGKGLFKARRKQNQINASHS